MPRKKSPWPKGLKIDPENQPLAALPEEHPARRALIARAICQRDCALRELPGAEGEAGVVQSWHSATLGRDYSLAEFIYEFVCVDFVLTEWLERPPVITAAERETLEDFPRLHALLREGRSAAEAENNQPILDLLPLAEAFVSTWESAIVARLQADQIPYPNLS